MSSSERTSGTSSEATAKAGLPGESLKGIGYSQTILDKLISLEKVSELIVSFEKTLIDHEWVHEFWEIYVRLKHVSSISCLWINWFCQRNTKSTIVKENVMYNRDWKKVERYISNHVLGFSVQYVHSSRFVLLLNMGQLFFDAKTQFHESFGYFLQILSMAPEFS